MKVCVVYYKSPSPFVIQDYLILKKRHDVRLVSFLSHPFRFLFYVARSDLCVCWFADLHSAVAIGVSRILGKKSIVVAGGYDVARVPEIEYGAFVYSPVTRFSAAYALNHADLVLAVDPSIVESAILNARISPASARYLPTGYEAEFWRPPRSGPRPSTIVTATRVQRETVKLKGLDTFARTAALVPEARFVIVGEVDPRVGDDLTEMAHGNLSLIGYQPQEALVKVFQEASVYCQLSRFEGLPNALCEAMLCGCIPVGTKAGGITTAIGDTGFFVDYGDETATAEAIRRALQSDDKHREEARCRIMRLFDISMREAGLLGFVAELRQELEAAPMMRSSD